MVAAFAVPAAANASFQARVIDKTHVSITGSDDAEAIVIGSDQFGRLTHDQTSAGFASALDFDTSLPGTQMVGSLPVLTVDGEGGDDRIEVTTNRVTLSVDGGEGDDVIRALRPRRWRGSRPATSCDWAARAPSRCRWPARRARAAAARAR